MGSTLHVPSRQETQKRGGDTSQFSVNVSPAQESAALKAGTWEKETEDNLTSFFPLQ